jgi:hypothetical protein
MKKSTRALLLSALVFPGSGHLYLKKYVHGLVLAGASLAALYYLFSKSMEEAMRIVENIQSGSVQPDVAAIMEMASNQPVGADAYLLDVATTVFIICWVLGMIDSYRVGRVQDRTVSA